MAHVRAVHGSGRCRQQPALPVSNGDRIGGTINIYAATANAFDDKQQALAGALGAPAEHAITNADLSFSTRLEAEHGPRRLADHDDVAIAWGIIAANQEVPISTAQERLREAASRAGITEGEAARAVRGVLRPPTSG